MDDRRARRTTATRRCTSSTLPRRRAHGRAARRTSGATSTTARLPRGLRLRGRAAHGDRRRKCREAVPELRSRTAIAASPRRGRPLGLSAGRRPAPPTIAAMRSPPTSGTTGSPSRSSSAAIAGRRRHGGRATSCKVQSLEVPDGSRATWRSPVDWDLAERVAVRVAGREPFADVVPLRLARPRLRRADGRGRGARRRGDRPALARRAGPGPGHRPRRLGARQHRVVPAAAAPAHRQARRAARPTTPLAPGRPARSPASRSARCSAGCRPGCSASTTCSSSRTRTPTSRTSSTTSAPTCSPSRSASPSRPASSGCGWRSTRSPTGRSSPGVPVAARRTSSSLVEQTPRQRRPRPEALPRGPRAGRSTRCGPAATRSTTAASSPCSPPPSSARCSQQIGGLMSLLEGHGDVTMDRAGADRIPQRRAVQPGAAAAPAARSRRRPSSLQKLIGLEAKMNQYEQGERFIDAVEAAGGPTLLDRAWEGPERLPTPGRDPRARPVDRRVRAAA